MCIVAGFDLRKRVPANEEDHVTVQIVGLASHIPFYGAKDLQELLAQVSERSPAASGEDVIPRPAAVRWCCLCPRPFSERDPASLHGRAPCLPNSKEETNAKWDHFHVLPTPTYCSNAIVRSNIISGLKVSAPFAIIPLAFPRWRYTAQHYEKLCRLARWLACHQGLQR